MKSQSMDTPGAPSEKPKIRPAPVPTVAAPGVDMETMARARAVCFHHSEGPDGEPCSNCFYIAGAIKIAVEAKVQEIAAWDRARDPAQRQRASSILVTFSDPTPSPRPPKKPS